MKKGIYFHLAWSGIKNNKKLYLPYILTCIGTIMVCYILSFLGQSDIVSGLKGGMSIQTMLRLGFFVMAAFSGIFLFYTNSFLIRRRKKEFGLYNVLGLGKKHLSYVLLLENLIIAAMTFGGGFFFGILFSKLAELGLVKIAGSIADYTYSISVRSITDTLLYFTGIFAVLFINGLIQVKLTNPAQLLRSENLGEKAPKANWFLAIVGLLGLIFAYYIAVVIEDPLSALVYFFVAVLLVIAATYLLFIAGSVTLCKLLQKNKSYYYKTNHFVSVSSMVYRMKRNGAGLASICILCTMVLVMVSSTVCLYIGMEDSLRKRYPRNVVYEFSAADVKLLGREQMAKVEVLSRKTAEQYGAELQNVLQYKSTAFVGVVDKQSIYYDVASIESQIALGDICQMFVVPLSDYNALMGEKESLEADEVMLHFTKDGTYSYDTIQLVGGEVFKVAKQTESFVDNGMDAMQMIPSLYIFTNEIERFLEPLTEFGIQTGEPVETTFYYGFDLSCEDETQVEIQSSITRQILEWKKDMAEFRNIMVYTESVAESRAEFYGLYGGLFFLGILLGAVFLVAAVLIIYYKQISEGFEDQSRFEIMQKVGMTHSEIKKSINSQILTVFFLPLITAGIHLAFAFPILSKLLLLFNLADTQLFITTTICCFIVFCLLYMIVYKATSNSYFNIVSGMKEA